MKFIIGDAHKIAYVLDPRYLGTGMSTADKNSAENVGNTKFLVQF